MLAAEDDSLLEEGHMVDVHKAAAGTLQLSARSDHRW